MVCYINYWGRCHHHIMVVDFAMVRGEVAVAASESIFEGG